MPLAHMILDYQDGNIDDTLTFILQQKPAYQKGDIKRLESHIRRTHPDQRLHSDSIERTIIPCGYYLGETLVRNLSHANWILQGEDLLDVRVEIQTSPLTFFRPFERVMQVLQGQEDTLFDWKQGLNQPVEPRQKHLTAIRRKD